MFLVFVCFNISLKKRLTSECRVQKAVYPRCDSRRPGKSPKLHTHFCRVDRQKLHEVRGTPARSRQDFLKFHLHLFTVLFKQSNLSSNKHTWRLLRCRIFHPVQLRQRESQTTGRHLNYKRSLGYDVTRTNKRPPRLAAESEGSFKEMHAIKASYLQLSKTYILSICYNCRKQFKLVMGLAIIISLRIISVAVSFLQFSPIGTENTGLLIPLSLKVALSHPNQPNDTWNQTAGIMLLCRGKQRH